MTMFAIERNGSLVNQVVFKGSSLTSLYRDREVVPMLFTTTKAAQEIADALFAYVVDYDEYLSTQLYKAA